MRKLSRTEVEDRWGRISELEKPFEILSEQFQSYEKPDEDGDYPFSEEFLDQYLPLGRKQNTLAFSLMREVLRRNRGGEDYMCIYPAAGVDADFIVRMGGEWTLLDKAYDKQREENTLERHGEKVYALTTIKHDFTTERLPKGVKKGSVDVGLIRHPLGQHSELDGLSGQTPERGAPKSGSVKWWNGLLMNCVVPLGYGGLLVSEDSLEKMMEETEKIGAKRVIGSYLSLLDGMTGLLGLPTNYIPFVEYRERLGSCEPRKFHFHFYRKLV